MTRFALLPSPLLGPASWAPVADALRALGHAADVVALPAGLTTPDGVRAAFEAGVPRDPEVVLVGHSGAGLYLPAAAQACRARALVFVDAALPAVSGATAVAPPDFLAFLQDRSDDGLLPPWSQWWDEDLAPLFPDAGTRAAVEAEQQRLPLSYFAGTVAVPDCWDERPCAYLAFGDTYAAETEQARARGWAVAVLPGEHLEQLVHPDAVAAAVVDLCPRV